jgi:thiol:disulfide interchange protein DsbA
MKTNLSLLGSVLLVSSIGLVACDSATATNDKQVADVKKAVVEQADAVKKVAQEAPKAAVEKATEVAKEVVQEAPKAVEKATEVAKEAIAPKVEEAVAAAPAAKADAPKVQAVVSAPEFREGQHYFEIFPTMQTDAVGGKIEVVELMWLGCPHCFDLEPTMKEYKKTLPDYVDFKQVPAMLNPRWTADGKMYYIAELLDPKGEKNLVDKVFHAIHVQKRRKMSNPDNLKSFMLQQGVSAEEYDSAANSMVLTAKLNRAQQVSADSQAQSVPSIIINGKYRTSPYAAGGNKQLMQIVEMLTKRELDK